jgi:RNA polymerase sigma factor (sigma-70 family)
MNWLKEVAKFHADYLRIVKSFGEDFYAEDVVQEMYIKLTKYHSPNKIINKEGKVNTSYIYLVLRSIVVNLKEQKNRLKKVSLEEIKELHISYDYIPKHEAELNLEARINKEIDTWDYFDERLFNIYRDSKMSMRKLSKETRISTKTIFYTIKRCKERLRENIGEDYEDYINEDYELI